MIYTDTLARRANRTPADKGFDAARADNAATADAYDALVAAAERTVKRLDPDGLVLAVSDASGGAGLYGQIVRDLLTALDHRGPDTKSPPRPSNPRNLDCMHLNGISHWESPDGTIAKNGGEPGEWVCRCQDCGVRIDQPGGPQPYVEPEAEDALTRYRYKV